MTTFSLNERQIIERFAGQLGLDARTAADGTFSFVFQQTGTLTLTPSADGRRTIVSLARRAGRLDPTLLLRALSQAGHDAARGRLLHAGLSGEEDLLFATCIDEGEISLPALEDCLQQLKGAHDALR